MLISSGFLRSSDRTQVGCHALPATSGVGRHGRAARLWPASVPTRRPPREPPQTATGFTRPTFPHRRTQSDLPAAFLRSRRTPPGQLRAKEALIARSVLLRGISPSNMWPVKKLWPIQTSQGCRTTPGAVNRCRTALLWLTRKPVNVTRVAVFVLE